MKISHSWVNINTDNIFFGFYYNIYQKLFAFPDSYIEFFLESLTFIHLIFADVVKQVLQFDWTALFLCVHIGINWFIEVGVCVIKVLRGGGFWEIKK